MATIALYHHNVWYIVSYMTIRTSVPPFTSTQNKDLKFALLSSFPIKHFQACPSIGEVGCLRLVYVDLFYENALLTCTLETENCTSTSFSTLLTTGEQN